MKQVPIFTKIALLIFLYYVVYYLYVGFLHPIPGLGDSFDYHIPISHMIINGSFLTVPRALLPQWYYPGASEAINALLILLHIPLTISNIMAIIVLCFSLVKLGEVFGLKRMYAVLFALAFCSMTAIIRWMNAVSIDVWVAVFFVLSLILLEQPKKTVAYFSMLGITTGMLIGSKYTAVYYLFVLILFYGKKLLGNLSLIRFFTFFVPFSLLGLFWYIRNYFLVHNPFYPLSFFGFPSKLHFTDSVWHVTLTHPFQTLTALFSEYSLFFLIPFFAIFWLLYRVITKRLNVSLAEKVLLLGLCNSIIFLFSPSDVRPEIMISSMRYSYPFMIPLILGIFILAAKYHKEEHLGFIAIACMLPTLTMSYYPKLLLIYLPLAGIFYYFLEKTTRSKQMSS